MPVHDGSSRWSSSRRYGHHSALLAGTSALALVLAWPHQAAALQPGRSGAVVAAPTIAANSAMATAQQAAAMAAQSQNSMLRATQAIQAMLAAQNAARTLAAAGPNNLGVDPNHPGQLLPNVPNGLGSGGLMPDSGLNVAGAANPVTTWVNATTPTQATSNGQTIVSIQQTAAQALLNWTTFNVGKTTTVNFNQQGNAGWIALNKISDPSGVPSQILGQIKADGQVLLINQNGIIFGGSSQINVHTLIASTLDLSPTVSGSNYKLFLQNGLFQSNAPSGFSGKAALFNTPGSLGTGVVTVQPGAAIDTTRNLNATGDGGYVALVGAGVTNAGTIVTQNGQIILAADSNVALIAPSSSAVGVQTAMQVVAGGGVVTNDVGGLLLSNDGAVTLAGGAINQLGDLAATTSVTRPGSISLNTATSPNGNPNNGNIVLGPTSLTAILPDETSGTLPTQTANSSVSVSGSLFAVPYFQAVLQPQINITAGGSVDIQGNGTGLGGASIKAPSAALTISANGSTAGGVGTILLEPGSSIDLSGLAGVTLPMSVNQISILVTSAEVADDPLARNLIGKTVTIDARLSGTRADGFHWVGSPILDAAGYVGLIPQSIDQLLTAGGSFKSSATNFIQQPGAAINVSGGYVQYLGGVINTTKLIGSDGRRYDIGRANPYIAYSIDGGFAVQHMIQGKVDPSLTQTWTGPGSSGHYEPGYIAGVSAGSIGVTAVVPILGGDLVADFVAGARQRALAGSGSANLAPSDQMPSGAALSINFASPGLGAPNPYNVVLAPQADAGADPYGLGSFSFATASTWTPQLANGVFPVFSDVLSNASLGSISIKGAHQLSMPSDATLSVLPGGSITLDGVTTIDGTLNAPAGKISLIGFTYAYATGPGEPPTPALIIGPDAVLNVRGLWVNDTGLSADQMQGGAYVNGGSVSMATVAASIVMDPLTYPSPVVFADVTQSIVLAPGSVIDLSSGGYVGTNGQLRTGADGLPVGKGGGLTLTTYINGPDSNLWEGLPVPGSGVSAPFNVLPQGTNPDGSVNHPNQANVVMGGTIYAQGFDGGGTFTLQVPTVTIDGAATQVTSYLSTAVAGAIAAQSGLPAATFATSDANAGQVVLPPALFNGGFAQYTLNSMYGSTTVTAGTHVAPRQSSLLVAGDMTQLPTGAIAGSVAPVGFLPDGLRKPVSLALNANNVLIDSGASIVADPQATISLAGGTVTVLGSITAPAGTINVTAFGEVWIGSGAVLDVSGVFVADPRIAYSTGTVYDGGIIAVSGDTVVTQSGAQFDLQGTQVSAASNLIQLPQGGLAQPRLLGQAAWSNGGNLQLTAPNLYFAGTVNAAGGAPLAAGGTLSVVVTGAALVVEPGGIVAANLPALGASTTPGAFIGADTLSNSGFDSITLKATTIAFGGSVNISIPGALTLSSGNLALLPASPGLLPAGVTDPLSFVPASCEPTCIPSIGGTTVNLNAGYVRIAGLALGGGNLALPNVADGTLNVTAQWIDLQGAIALDNVGNANFTSTSAIRFLPDNYGGSPDVRTAFGGVLIAPGNLTLQAAVIYPATNTQFLLMSSGTLASDSTLTIKPNGAATAPLSAGGGIVLDALTIVQDGTLWAPLGSIILGLQNTSQIPTAVSQIVGNAFNVAVTQNVTVGAGSLTSVSAAGLVIPYGTTLDGKTWYPDGPPVAVTPALTAPPAKSIGIFGANITTEKGAILDLSGGGDIYATEYVSGTGGTRNVLTSYQQVLGVTNGTAPQYADGRQVYALVPTYQATVAAYDPGFAGNPYYSGLAKPLGTNDPNIAPSVNAIAPGMSVTIAAGSGIPAGTYTLLPGMYATLPGAYRVVQTASNVNPAAARSFTTADGSAYVVGTLGNALTGARSSQSALFQIQSNAVWTQDSKINIASGTSFFRNLALAAKNTPPPLPIDGGVLTLAATNTLTLLSTNNFAAGTSDLAAGLSGAGGQVQISAANILILASDQAVPGADCLAGSGPGCTGTANYLVLDADQISRLGAASVLIGGSAVLGAGVETITPTALNLEVATDLAHPLTGPELLLVSLAQVPGVTVGNGITVDAGSVIRAVGKVPAGTDRSLRFGADPIPQFNINTGKLTGYIPGITGGDGSLLRVSNGTPVSVNRFFVPGVYTGPGPKPVGNTPLGTFSIGAGVTIDGGNALTLDTSGGGTLASDVILKAANYDLAGDVINIGGGNSGLVLNTRVVANFADAVSVSLRSVSVINLYDAGGLTFGDPAHPIGKLTFDAAGLYSQGGVTTVDALNVVLTDSQPTPNTTGALAGAATGTLDINAGVSNGTVFGTGTLTLGAGSVTLGNFNQVNLAASQAVAFNGRGGVNALDAGAANVLLSAPEVLVMNAGTTQSLTTTGALVIAPGAGTAPSEAFNSAGFGGNVAISAASIADSGLIVARSAKVSLTATTGNLELMGGAGIDARGAVVTVLDQVGYVPGGSVQLIANAAGVTPAGGNVLIDPGAKVDVSAMGFRRAGSLTIKATGAASLNGSLQGSAAAVTDSQGNIIIPAFKDMGGSFTLNAGSLSAGSQLPTGFTGSIAVTLQQGDIVIGTAANALAPALSAGQITLTAANGSVLLYGSGDALNPNNQLTILDASGLNGQIALYGTTGVTLNSGVKLTAAYVADDPRDPNYANGTSALVQNGGTITLGTSGTPNGSTNTTYGYQNVDTSGAITVASNVLFDVSGGPGGANISNTGGSVIIRAPILTTGNVNVSFQGTLVSSTNGGPSGAGVVLNAYAVWSTTDATTGGQHFDGIIDPAGWFNANGTKIAGTTTDGDIFTPTGVTNSNHINFYQTTLVNFVQNAFGNGNTSAVQADFSGASGLNVGTTLHFRPEIDLVSPSSGTGGNGGNITVASNWNLGGVTTAPTASQNVPLTSYLPAYRTIDSTGLDAGEAGVLSLHAANNIAINATISDGFYETYDAFGKVAVTSYNLVANLIANNPAKTSISGAVVNDLNTTSAASLMSIVPGVNDGSFSYDFVAGAALGSTGVPSANPNAVVDLTSPVSPGSPNASVTINGHTTYTDTFRINGQSGILLPFATINIPTLVRTGTGSITITAAGNVEFLDQVTPGAVYTAGAATATPADFNAPALAAAYKLNPNGLVSTPSWATGGGAVTVTAGGSIIGIEMPTDGPSGSQFGVKNGPTGQLWSDWYIHYGLSNGSTTPFSGCAAAGPVACQTAAWINYATMFQGFGALGGGNITLAAGADIIDIGASLPETLVVGGGFTAADAPRATYFGGGNLLVQAGGNLLSSDFLVGRGSGLIQVGGTVQATTSNPLNPDINGQGQPTLGRTTDRNGNVTGSYALPLLLAVQDGFITLTARGAVTLGSVYDPASLPLNAAGQTFAKFQPGAQPGAVGSNLAWSSPFTSFGPNSGVSLTSATGDVTALTINPNPARAVISGLFVHNGATFISSAARPTIVGLLLPATLDLSALGGNIVFNNININKAANPGSANLMPYPTQTASDTGTITIVAAGSIDLGSGLTMPDLDTGTAQFVGNSSNAMHYDNYISPLGVPLANLTVPLHANDPAPVIIAAGQDINAAGASVMLIKPAQIEAGNNINGAIFTGQNNNPGDITSIVAGNNLTGGSYALYGPGILLLQSGHDMAPSGIATLGNGSNAGGPVFGLGVPVRPYLPSQGAEIDVLFGVKPRINYAGAIANYIDPAQAGAGGIDLLANIATVLGQSRDQAWITFQGLSPVRQQLLIDRAFLDFLTQVAADYNNKSSTYYLQYGRAYQAIATLFPAGSGYTDNAGGGSGSGAAAMIQTGNLNMAGTLLETQMGGDINIIGPGGSIQVGHTTLDTTAPNAQGILTLAGGTIRAYTDGSILVNQSRIMTEQGGDINLFSANGDISAGEGPKTYVSDPPISQICDANGYCDVNPQGLVTGAGIGALVTLPGQDIVKRNVSLAAPHGTIDAGAAGLRGNNINLVYSVLLNSFNIQTTGTVTGISYTPPPNAAALATNSNANTAIQQTGLPARSNNNDRPSIIIVEVLGYGGGGDTPVQDQQDNDQRRKARDQQGYNQNSAVQFVKFGETK